MRRTVHRQDDKLDGRLMSAHRTPDTGGICIIHITCPQHREFVICWSAKISEVTTLPAG